MVPSNRRNGKFENRGSGMLISLALDCTKKHTVVMPDIDFANSSESDSDNKLSEKDNLMLDLLCSFDFIYCLCVAVSGNGSGGAYPSCVAFSEKRISPVILKVFGDRSDVRRLLFPKKTDSEIAEGLRQVYQLIGSEAMHASQYVWGFDETGLINRFLSEYPSEA